MGFFSNLLGSIKNAGKSVVGALKIAGKKIGDVGQAALDFSRDHGIGQAIQTAGAIAGVAGVAAGSTVIGAPIAAGLEGLGAVLTGGGTLLKSAEDLSDRSSSIQTKVGKVALDIAAPYVLGGAAKLGAKAAAPLLKSGVTTAVRSGPVQAIARQLAPTGRFGSAAMKYAPNVSKAATIASKAPAGLQDRMYSKMVDKSISNMPGAVGPLKRIAMGASKLSGVSM